MTLHVDREQAERHPAPVVFSSGQILPVHEAQLLKQLHTERWIRQNSFC
jgi:hypothetical protein